MYNRRIVARRAGRSKGSEFEVQRLTWNATGTESLPPGDFQAGRALCQPAACQRAGGDPPSPRGQEHRRLLCPRSAQGLLCCPHAWYQQHCPQAQKGPPAPPPSSDEQRRLHQGQQGHHPDAPAGRALCHLRRTQLEESVPFFFLNLLHTHLSYSITLSHP